MAFCIAAELAPHRINVNVIEPGWIDTPGKRETFWSDAIAAIADSMPWSRLGTADDVGHPATRPPGHPATFLASDDADSITGTTLRVDGG